jgi:hypothetical protein
VSDVISSSSYGNPGIGSCGVGIVSEGVGVDGVVVVTFLLFLEYHIYLTQLY